MISTGVQNSCINEGAWPR